MNKKFLILGVFAITMLVGVLAFGVSDAFAYRGNSSVKGPNFTAEREAAMDSAFESGNFDAWKSLMTEAGRNPGVLRVIDTQAEFLKLAQAHALTEEGKTEEANAIRTELGLGVGARSGGFGQRGMGNGACVNMQ